MADQRLQSTKLPEFADAGLLDILDGLPVESFDGLDFGLVTMDRTGTVEHYNTYEARRSGISEARVLGRNFFVDVGPCTNNFMIAERYHDAGPDRLDVQLDYVFTFRMRATPVRLRLLAAPGSTRQYLAVQNR
jgi:photoactive yellow protein